MSRTNTIKANPLRWLWNQAKRAYQRVRGSGPEPTVLRELTPGPEHRDRFLTHPDAQTFVNETVDALGRGDISIQRWRMDFRRELRKAYTAEYLYGKGGVGAMTAADRGRLGGMLAEQYKWMDKFAAEMAQGNLSPVQVKARMGMYFSSSRESYERSRTASWGMPRLPAYPGDGSTQCRVNCQCSWRIAESETAWEAVWELGAAEHCPDCLQRAERWAPLIIPKPMGGAA